jgi:hypothetical protein
MHQVLGCADRRARYDLELTSSVFTGFAAAGDDWRRRSDAGGEQGQDADQAATGDREREDEQQQPIGKEESARQQRMSHLPAWATSHEVRPLRPRPGARRRHASAVLDNVMHHSSASRLFLSMRSGVRVALLMQSITGTAWEAELRKDLWEALGNAFVGPPLHADVGRRFPEHFETELRGSPQHPDLMHIVSGRIQLGVVRQREAAPALPHHAQLGGADSGRRRGDDERGASSSSDSHDDDRRRGSRLELLYGDCGLLMESHENHTIDPRTGTYATCLEMHADSRLAYRCLGELSGRLGQRVHVMDNANRVTHVGVCGSAPLVRARGARFRMTHALMSESRVSSDLTPSASLLFAARLSGDARLLVQRSHQAVRVALAARVAAGRALLAVPATTAVAQHRRLVLRRVSLPARQRRRWECGA